MAANSQQFYIRGEPLVRRVHEVSDSSSHLDQRMGSMERMVKKIAAVIVPSYDEGLEKSSAVFPNKQRQYDPYSNTYNPGWRDHPNFSLANKQGMVQQPTFNYPNGFQPQKQPTQSQDSRLDEKLQVMMQGFTTMFQQSQKETKSAIKDLQTQVGSMAIDLNQFKAQNGGKIPSQPFNPRENVSVITLRSGTQLVQPKIIDEGDMETQKEPVLEEKNDDCPETSEADLEKDILDIFKKLHVNIPLIDVIKQVLQYAKVLKDLCTKKKRLTSNEVMSVGGNASAVLQKKLPPKCMGPVSFTIPVEIGNTNIGKAMLDLGASVNVIPAYIYESLNLGPLKPTNIVLELADRTNVYPRGNIEDVLVQVNQLVFPADFCVLEMDDGSDASIPLLLGRPFMKTAKTVIDVDEEILTMKFDDEIIRFNMFEVMRYPSDVHSGVHNVWDPS
ncbi:uncharacterized protein LOC113316019 [Papaver somniferum]|uniref:uncharacterized protein LOC113316019 n=1 Tax=Papaver somniferum TaxID=3469 RepID=UPI000E6FBDAA|nr:uncharacterized protein LOC113316019 [Papaver somniferum]